MRLSNVMAPLVTAGVLTSRQGRNFSGQGGVPHRVPVISTAMSHHLKSHLRKRERIVVPATAPPPTQLGSVNQVLSVSVTRC